LNRIVDREILETVCRIRHKNGHKIVVTNGCFDVLHAGHFALLKGCRVLADAVVVLVNTDESVQSLKGSGRPIVPLRFRLSALSNLPWVDYVVPFKTEEELEELLVATQADLLVKGSSYMGKKLTGETLITRWGGKVVYIKEEEGFSTTTLLQEGCLKGSPPPT